MTKVILSKVGAFLAGALIGLVLFAVVVATLKAPGLLKLYSYVPSQGLSGDDLRGEHAYIVEEVHAWEASQESVTTKLLYAANYRGFFLVYVGVLPSPDVEPEFWTLVFAYNGTTWELADAWLDVDA